MAWTLAGDISRHLLKRNPRGPDPIGAVYFAETKPADGKVKIGFTSGSVGRRVSEFQYAAFYKGVTEVVGTVQPVPRWMESYLHHYFREHRVERELFRKDGDLAVFVSYISDTENAQKTARWFLDMDDIPPPWRQHTPT